MKPKWVFEAVSKRFDYRPTLLQGFIGATELARDAAFSRTIALLKERLVLGASRLNIGRQRGGNRRKPYDGNTHYGPSLALRVRHDAADRARMQRRGLNDTTQSRFDRRDCAPSRCAASARAAALALRAAKTPRRREA